MARELELSSRLRAVAELVPPGSPTADIGADHGYLSIWLAQSGRAPRVIATDARPGPLEKARRNVEQAGVSGQVELRLGDGLSVLASDEADCVILAGMGGETIAGILHAAGWCAEGRHTLILQPMSKTGELRRYLAGNGYLVSEERLVREGGVIYCVLCAKGGVPARDLEPWECCIGAALWEKKDALFPAYLTLQRKRLERAMRGAARSRKECDKLRLAEFYAAFLRLRQMEEEYDDGTGNL